MKQVDQIRILSLLTEAADCRAFMQSYIVWRKSTNPRFGYANLARDAGFTARSYPREIIQGTRKITAASLPRFLSAMKLTGEAAIYFQLLAARDYPALSRESDITGALKKSRAKLFLQLRNREGSVSKVYTHAHWPLVFAAVSCEAPGSLVSEISARCHIPVSACLKILKAMRSAGVIHEDSIEEKFYSSNSHIVRQDLGADFDFQRFFISSLQRAEKQATEKFARTDSLFFASAVSIRRQDLKKFRDQLRDLMMSFTEAIETSPGDEVVSVVASLFPQK